MLPVYLPKIERKQKKSYKRTHKHTHVHTHVHTYTVSRVESEQILIFVLVALSLGSDFNV